MICYCSATLEFTELFQISFDSLFSHFLGKQQDYKNSSTKFQEITGYLHDLQIELQVQAGCHPEEYHSTAALQLLQTMKNTFSEVEFGHCVLLSSYIVT